METKLLRIAELAGSYPRMQFTSLAHLLDKESLKQCHHELPGNKATGIMGVTKEDYGEELNENVENLVRRMKKKSYRPQPVRRTYIDKAGSKKKRPLGIPEHEDKTNIIPFGRFAEKNCRRSGNRKPSTFNFLGFTHYCSQSQKGKFRVKRKTDNKNIRAKVRQTKNWLKANRTKGAEFIMDRIRRSLIVML